MKNIITPEYLKISGLKEDINHMKNNLEERFIELRDENSKYSIKILELEQELQKTREQLENANTIIQHVVYNTNDSQGLAYEYLEANLLLK